MIGLAMVLLQMHGFMLQQTLPISILPWFPITIVVALAVVLIAAMIYMLAPILNSDAMREWSRFQIYEAILSIVLIVIFLGVVRLLFLNPQPGLASIGLVPQGCNSAATNTVYSLSACDLAQFNTASYTLAGYLWGFSVFRSLWPNTQVSITPFPNVGDEIEFQVSIPSIVGAANTNLMKYLLEAILAALLLSQLQLILLSSSLMLMSLFFAVGFISRVFGISRSFGGAMIAFGIGLGIIYPLLISITYGYIDVSAGTYCFSSIAQTAGCTLSSVGSTFYNAFYTAVFSPFASIFSLFATGPTQTAVTAVAGQLTTASAFATLFNEVGNILAGLTVIPIVNILIVDVFIIDFSKAVGERMSFQMLFQGVI
jgi:hypothetical protein